MPPTLVHIDQSDHLNHSDHFDRLGQSDHLDQADHSDYLDYATKNTIYISASTKNQGKLTGS